MPPEEEQRAGPPARRYIQMVHAMPGRVRFRLSWLHDQRGTGEATRLADELALLAGMREVEIRVFTGAVLCHHDPQRVGPAAIAAELVRITGVDTTLGPGERRPADGEARGGGPGVVAREVARFFKDLDDKVLAATDGKVDLGTVATFGFLGAGALNLVAGGKATAPPWFNLAWWGLRTFMLFEADAVVDGNDE